MLNINVVQKMGTKYDREFIQRHTRKCDTFSLCVSVTVTVSYCAHDLNSR